MPKIHEIALIVVENLLDPTGKVNAERCAKCGGKCCKYMPGAYSPEDLGAPDKELMLRRLKPAFQSGALTYNYWTGDPTGKDKESLDTVYYPMPASNRGTLSTMSSPCHHHTDKGCKLPFSERPKQCRELVPGEEKAGCSTSYANRETAIDWLPYQDVMREVLHGE